MSSRLRSQDGFTLPEMLTAISIALIVSLAAFSLIEVVMRRAGDVAGRVEASQKGRAAMDFMTRQLRSQVCLSSTVPPMVSATPDSVTFYTDLSDPAAGTVPEKHTLTYDPVKRTIVERAYAGTGAAPAITYPATPSRVKLLAENVVRDRPAGAPADTPVFRYHAFDLSTPPRPQLALATPLNATDLARVARMEITFRKLPPSEQTRGSIVLYDEVYVRAADPNDPAPTPTCA